MNWNITHPLDIRAPKLINGKFEYSDCFDLVFR